MRVALRDECPSGKLGYKNRREALRVMNQVRAGRHTSLGPLPRAVYKCDDCRRWHMTKSTTREEH